ncbi:unnamed protein product, partial [Schistosoma rodhaini]|uniref:Uncharacterized protein n=1 Tax=Schistosoma rodhaini TaxID=6188 RepID=A0AA85F068_9TREM
MSETPDRLISLEELETMFKDRYTDKDVNYQKYLSNANVPPPIIPHWEKRKFYSLVDLIHLCCRITTDFKEITSDATVWI